MGLLQHKFGVCERTSDSFFAEPLNALTSLLFLVTAVAIYRFYRDHSDVRGKWIWDVHALTFLTACICVGSFSFHTMPSPVTELIDIVPIVMFIVIYFISAIFRVARASLFEGIISFIAFAGFTHILVAQFPDALNDSIGYFSSMTALIVIALYLNMKRRAAARAFLVAAITGVISLFFRSVDNAICDEIPIGTHFLWHALNALLIYMLMIQLIRNVDRRARMLRLANEEHA